MTESQEPDGQSKNQCREDEWKHQSPYRARDSAENFQVKWRGKCHCGRIQYQLSRDRPLASKYCHCRTCQQLHGAPFQWAAIFHKEDVNFTFGHHGLSWYDSDSQSRGHRLPCKVQCSNCWGPIMDEGRNMILLFPSLIEGIDTEEGREAFRAQCHIFYSQRVVDFRGDGLKKFEGLDGKSPLLGDDGEREAG